MKEFSPYAGRNFPTRPLWGDQHLHMETSVDAGTMVRLSQEDACRFARGEEITSTTGVRAKLSRPLDWLVISDHAEMYGLMPQLLSGDRGLLANKEAKRWYDALKTGEKKKMFATAMETAGALSMPEPPFETDKVVRKAWEKYTALADSYNEPGRFSAIIGYEYTTRGGFNLHRNVLFRGDASMANQMLPFSQFDSHERMEKHVVTGRIAAPNDIDPAQLLDQIDQAVAERSPCQIYIPDLCRQAGLEDHAQVEQQRFDMLRNN